MLLPFSVTDVITIYEIRVILVHRRVHAASSCDIIVEYVCDGFVAGITPYLNSFLQLLEKNDPLIFLLERLCKQHTELQVHTVPHDSAVMGSITVPT